MPARQKPKPATGRKTKVKTRGRTHPIIDQQDASGNPIPMNRYQSTVTKANNVGPFTRSTK
jgi:hypothetical protein